MPNWQGKKSAGSHTTLIEAAVPFVKQAQGMERVKKISLGIIKPTPNIVGRRRIKFTAMSGGLKATIRGNTSLQEIRIYTSNVDEVKKELEKVFLEE